MKKLVLASSSPYRKQLLEKLRLDFIISSAHIDETAHKDEAGDEMAIRLAIAKAQAVAAHFTDHLIIGSDQVAMFEQRPLGKPGDRDNAIRQLNEQSGQAVKFYTGLCLLNSNDGNYLTALDTCTVYFKQLTEAQIRHYVELERPYDCAGSFKSEGLGIALFEKIEGDDPNALIGLPLIKLVSLLEQFGHSVL